STQSLSRTLNQYEREKPFPTPLFIAVDQEGGRVQRCKEGFTILPPASDLIEREGESIRALGAQLSKELRLAGVNMNFAPVVDVLNSESGVLQGRAISKDPSEVVRVAASLLEGYDSSNLIGVLKHFPGHGSVKGDSHFVMPIVEKTLIEMENCDLLPYRELIKKVDAIMMAHILVPALDPDNMVTFSKKWHRYLRGDLGFEGVIVSDSLTMKPVHDIAHTLEEGALRAIQAGSDLLIIGGKTLEGHRTEFISPSEIRRIVKYVVQRAEVDSDLKTRVEESYARIISLKRKKL
ncbi:MAG: glycoside hydrolase family 3 N-terminal domain-containing protein, partial [Chlamydiia bacterium]